MKSLELAQKKLFFLNDCFTATRSIGSQTLICWQRRILRLISMNLHKNNKHIYNNIHNINMYYITKNITSELSSLAQDYQLKR